MTMESLLLATVFLPLAGAVVMALGAPAGRDFARWCAAIVSVVTLVMASVLVYKFTQDNPTGGWFAVTNVAWLGGSTGVDINLRLALDGLSIWLFGLSALLTVTAVLVSWEAIEDRAASFFALLLLLECGCLGVFAARDVLLFYIFFEFTLIPLFFLIGVWGSEERRYAAIKFFLFTLAGSVLTFLGLLAMVLWNRAQTGTLTFSMAALEAGLARHPIEGTVAIGGWRIDVQMLVFLALFAGFAVKVPLVPLHTWLPLAHVQAPTAGSVILAGVLLKIGTYGFVRFNMALLPEATAAFTPCMLWLAVAGIVYGAMVALAQTDIKRLIAYSSVSHLGFCMLGLFALNRLGTQGAVLQMVNHGISTGALFALVGMLYERYHTRQIAELGGVARRMPWLAFFMLLFALSSIGLPGLNGFAGEFLVLVGMFQRAWSGSPDTLSGQLLAIAVLALTGVILGAWYMLWLVQRVFFGPLKEPRGEEGGGSPSRDGHAPVPDLSVREILSLAPLAVLVFWIGLVPETFLAPLRPALDPIVGALERPFHEYHGSPERTVGPAGPAADHAEKLTSAHD